MTSVPGTQLLTDLVGRVREGWPGAAWEWDGRLDCVLSTVTKEHVPAARQALEAGLPAVWKVDNLPQAPSLVRQICAKTGGLRAQQMVFSAELPDGAIVYCLWWPWGNGANFSARIGTDFSGAGAALRSVVRSAFGIT
jgi:hypothetical protein